MGKNQKIKEQRKIERIEEYLSKNKFRKKFFTFGGACLVLVAILIIFFTNKPNNNNTANMQNTIPEIKTEVKSKIAVLETNFGTIKLKMFDDAAPKTVDNFVTLINSGFYDGSKFHRVMKDFMIQGGDPNSKDNDWSNDGQGGPGYKFDDEINSYKLIRGRIAMANSGPNTNGSQFFIVTAQETTWLDGKHTVFGEVIDGINVVDKIESLNTNEDDHPLEDAIIVKASVEEK